MLHFQQAQEPVSFYTWVRKKSTTIYLGVVANKNKGKGEEGSEDNERSEQRDT